MIKKFVPQDFEECLMGLPIANWLILDKDKALQKTSYPRPRMMINHLEELKGITEIGDSFYIKAYTQMETLKNSKCLPSYMVDMMENLMKSTRTSFDTLGCYLTSDYFSKYFYALMVGLDTEVVLKSYMKERRILLRKLLNIGKLQINNYDEILYELIINKVNFDYVYLDKVDIDGEVIVYFLAFNKTSYDLKDLKLVLMYPSKRFVRFDAIKDLKDYANKNLVDYYNEEIKYLSISLKHKDISLKFFNQVFDRLIRGEEETL